MLQTNSGLVSLTQAEGVLRSVAGSLSRHQAIAILRQLPRNNAQQVSLDALIGALAL